MHRKSVLSFLCFFATAAFVFAEPPAAPDAPEKSSAPPTPSPSAPGIPSKSPAEAAAPDAPPAVGATPDEHLSVVRVNVTNQPWDFSRPWGKRAPFTRRAIGPVIEGNRVLVTAELVTNATFIEFETPEGGRKVPAKVAAVDYDANVAVLTTEDNDFLAEFKPIALTTAKVGDTLAVWQLENTGVLLVTAGPMTSTEVVRYPMEESAYLIYRATVSLQSRDSSFTLPVVKDGKLAGLVMRYENSSNNCELVPTPVIEHFLKDAQQAPYDGFPSTGISFSNTRDPQFRRYVGLTESKNNSGMGGVYVIDLRQGSPGEKAGLQSGDVILNIDGQAIDQDGNYKDPDYGKIALNHLISTRHFKGDKVTFNVFRNGETKDIDVELGVRAVEEYVVEPHVIDRAPKFYVYGGLVLQELSRQFLKEWGGEWSKRAPQELVYIDRYQSELYKDDPSRKVVFLNRVLPSPATIGYEDLSYLVITKINDQEIKRLADVPAALEKAADGLHKIEFDTDPSIIYLDGSAMKTVEPTLVKNYRLPLTKRLE